ncbi:MAG: 50S ribosomal protein L32 [Patescibacteria group bacterium]
MAMPKKRMSHKRSSDRRSHLSLSETQFAECAHCQAPTLSHQVCKACGYYGDRLVIPKKQSTTILTEG